MDSYGAWGRPARAATRPIRKNEPHFRVFRCFSLRRVASRCTLSGVRERPIMTVMLRRVASGDALRGRVVRRCGFLPAWLQADHEGLPRGSAEPKKNRLRVDPLP